eukprot:SAG11_NODE_6151_length_1375_cov_1.985904_2_plen_69_part_00
MIVVISVNKFYNIYLYTNENILNPDIYKKAKQKADKVYKRHSAYKSMYISKTYEDMGGKYKTEKKETR